MEPQGGSGLPQTEPGLKPEQVFSELTLLVTALCCLMQLTGTVNSRSSFLSS